MNKNILIMTVCAFVPFSLAIGMEGDIDASRVPRRARSVSIVEGPEVRAVTPSSLGLHDPIILPMHGDRVPKRVRSFSIVDVSEVQAVITSSLGLHDPIILPMCTTPAVDIFSRIPMNPLYLKYGPSNNAKGFAAWLVQNEIDARDFTVEKASKKYAHYIKCKYKRELKDQLIRQDKNPKTYKNYMHRIIPIIDVILPVFKDMYSGIIYPAVERAARRSSERSAAIAAETDSD
ncbi:MAG: hypothetical protein V4482_04645 [Pseudomonadota bacterium]